MAIRNSTHLPTRLLARIRNRGWNASTPIAMARFNGLPPFANRYWWSRMRMGPMLLWQHRHSNRPTFFRFRKEV